MMEMEASASRFLKTGTRSVMGEHGLTPDLEQRDGRVGEEARDGASREHHQDWSGRSADCCMYV